MSIINIGDLSSETFLASYRISRNGFLPALSPLSRLPHPYYMPWERIAENLSMLLESRELRQRVDDLPVLGTLHLSNEREWQRAYSMLAIMAQAYIWQGPGPSERLPPAISVAFIDVADHLEVYPVATYAALNLWNWRPLEEGIDLSQPSNMDILLNQTGTKDESWFFLVSNAMEARAGPVLRKLLAAMEAVERNDDMAITESLRYFAKSISELGELLEKMDQRCDPHVFYHKIRPFLAGSSNMEALGLPNGVFYDEGNGKGSWRMYRGASNGQSSLIQFFDVALGVDHNGSEGFHAEMRDYMPGPHKRFLNDLETISNIRPYVEDHQEKGSLLSAYNDAISGLSRFRNKHIALVTRYVIVPSSKTRSTAGPDTGKALAKCNSTQELVGTGGTKLIPFLRKARDETNATAII